MLAKIILAALACSPLVAAHGKIAVVTGDAGGNTTALGIKGGIVPGAGSNDVTEIDTTVFSSTKIKSNGLGQTTSQGKNKVTMLKSAMALSGDTLPQVSADGGSLSGTFHIVTTDGAGPVSAVIDSTARGHFSNGTELTVTTQVPGEKGNIAARDTEGLIRRALRSVGLVKRAANVNKSFPVAVSVPAGTTCTGTINGIENVCLAKIANSNAAGPFGGVVAFQIASTSTTSSAAAASSSTVSSCKAAKRAVQFKA